MPALHCDSMIAYHFVVCSPWLVWMPCCPFKFQHEPQDCFRHADQGPVFLMAATLRWVSLLILCCAPSPGYAWPRMRGHSNVKQRCYWLHASTALTRFSSSLALQT